MNNDIKEILDYLKKYIDDETTGDVIESKYTMNLLLDYITNLQEQLHQASLDIQELTEKDIGCPSWCDKLTNLQAKNEKANTLLDELLERAYIDGEYIMYDYSTSELLEVKQALQGEDKDE